MTAAELYAALCQFADDNGWERQIDTLKDGTQHPSGWWWHDEGQDCTIGELVEEELKRHGVDVRKPPPVTIHVDEPGTLEAGSG